MLLRTAGRSWLLTALFALGGCGDFTLVDPQPEGPLFSMSLRAVSDETGSMRYDLEAAFRPGRDRRGEPTQVADRALEVDGTTVLPDPETAPGTWLYRWQATRAATTDGNADTIRVRFPAIAGSSPSTYSVAIPVTQRVGPADVRLTRGEDLVLRVSSTSAPLKLSGSVDFWTLQIRQSCSHAPSGPHVQIQGTSRHPSELRVPGQWLERLPAGPMAACFLAGSSFQVVGSPYPSFVSVAVQLSWRIEVVEPGT